MKSRSAKLLLAVLCITGVLLLELNTPAPGQSEEFWSGTVTANVNLRNAPSLKGAIVKGLLKGSPVKIYEEQNGWYRISAQKYHQVFKGWVSIEYVEIIAEEPADTAPAAEVPEPETQAPLQAPVAEPAQPAPIIEPDKPLPPPAPVEETVLPEPKSPSVATAEPEPETKTVEQPPQTKVVVPKPEKPPQVEKPSRTAPAPTPADDWMHMLPMALPVVAVVVLLIVVIVYRVKRNSGKKAGETAEHDEWSIPQQESTQQALEASTSFEEALRPLEKETSEHVEDEPGPSFEEELSAPEEDDSGPSVGNELSEAFKDDSSPTLEDERSEPLEDDLSLSFEDELSEVFKDDPSQSFEEEPREPLGGEPGPSLDAELDESYGDDQDLLLEEDLDEAAEEEPSQSLEEVLSEGIDFQLEDTPDEAVKGDESASPTRDAAVYDQVVEIISRMSNVELTELLDLVNSQFGEKSRQDDRLTFYSMVDFVVEGQYYRDFIQDLSASGVFIKGHHMFEPGQLILMTFMAPYFQKPFKISGEIVRILDDGIGVKFDQESQVQAEAISALMDQIRMLEGEA